MEPGPCGPAPDGDWADRVRRPRPLGRPQPDVERALVAGIRDAAAAGFETRFRAAGRLVSMGEIALPYLGHAATCGLPDGSRPALDEVVRVILRDLPPAALRRWYASAYPLLRATAAETAAARGRTADAAMLLQLLEDGEPFVRGAAVRALRTLYGDFLGYRPADAPSENEEPIVRWQARVERGS